MMEYYLALHYRQGKQRGEWEIHQTLVFILRNEAGLIKGNRVV